MERTPQQQVYIAACELLESYPRDGPHVQGIRLDRAPRFLHGVFLRTDARLGPLAGPPGGREGLKRRQTSPSL